MGEAAQQLEPLNVRSNVHNLGLRGRRPAILSFLQFSAKRAIKRYDGHFSKGEDMFKSIEEATQKHELTQAQKELMKLNRFFIEQAQDFYTIYYDLARLRWDTIKDLKHFLDSHKIPEDVRKKYFGKAVSEMKDIAEKEREGFNRMRRIIAGESSIAQEIINFKYIKNDFVERWAVWSQTRRTIKDVRKARKLEHKPTSEETLKELADVLVDEFEHSNKAVSRLLSHLERMIHLSQRAYEMVKKAAYEHEVPAQEEHDQKMFEIALQEMLLREVQNLQRTVTTQLRNKLGELL